MPKTEVSWTREDAEGIKRRYTAHSVGGRWTFRTQAARFDPWTELAEPSLEDWLELLDGVERRVGRGLAQAREAAQLRRHVKGLFPGAEIPG